MIKYIISRIINLIPVLFFMSIIVFLMMHLIPGDPVVAMLGIEATEAEIEMTRAELGFDKPIVIQYFVWISKVIRGDFGESVITGYPVLNSIIERFPATLLLASAAIILSLLIAILLGTFAAANKGSFKDISVLILSMLGVSIPSFALGVILVQIFSIEFSVLPAIGYEPFFKNFPGSLRYLILPSLTLGAINAAAITRMTRAEMIEQLSKDYIITAKAKGLSRLTVIYKHAFRNSLITVVTYSGIQLGSLLGGTIIVEAIFTWPGIGFYVWEAIQAKDYPIVQGIVLLVSFSFVLINLLVDISYFYLNPQIRLKRSES
jgi:peptide/nickel transport system permease protein